MAELQGQPHLVFHDDVIHSISTKYRQFDKEIIEKALSATGHKKQDTVVKWLFAHSEEGGSLADPIAREYIVFLCPTGPLLSEVSNFYEVSFNQCGSNAAHNLFPHITLSSFFKVEDSLLPVLLDIFQRTLQNQLSKKPSQIDLLLQRSENYIGLFLSEAATVWVTETIHLVARTVETELGVLINPHDRKFHLTLAYNFNVNHTQALEALARKINVYAPARWELNVYSRDTRFNGKQVHVALQEFHAREQYEIDLKEGGHVIMTSEQEDYSPYQGWKEGESFASGKVGFFPEATTKKTAEWRIWTKNLSLTVFKNTDKQRKQENVVIKPPRRSQSLNLKKNKDRVKEEPTHPQWEPVVVTVGEHVKQPAIVMRSPFLTRHSSSRGSVGRSPGERRKVREERRNSDNNTMVGDPNRMFFMRHAERVDLTFGHDWFKTYIDEKGYHRRNLNLPQKIPTRRGGPRDFFMDGPITEIGSFQARLMGEAMRVKGVTFSHVFSSPSLRSVQTASSLLDGLMDQQTRIKLEPALFEWTVWCRNTLPHFMDVQELCEYGINVDKSYSPYFTKFNLHEKTDEYYHRSHAFVDHVTRTHGGNILFVGHSATLDVCTRKLTGKKIRKTDDLVRVVQKVPFCGLCVAEQQGDNRWGLVQAPIPSLAHGQNQSFDWRVLLD